LELIFVHPSTQLLGNLLEICSASSWVPLFLLDANAKSVYQACIRSVILRHFDSETELKHDLVSFTLHHVRQTHEVLVDYVSLLCLLDIHLAESFEYLSYQHVEDLVDLEEVLE